MTYALDTSIIVDFLRKNSLVVSQFDKTAMNGIEMVIPSVVDYEILRGFCYAPSPRKEAVYDWAS